MSLAAGAALLSACARAPEQIERITVPQLEEKLEAAAKTAPGVVFGAVWKDGTTVERAAGSADLRSARKLTPETPFAWFSVTKLFTATAILQLAERGRVDLDAPAETYLPGLRLEREGRKATVRQLLAHTAGVPNPVPEVMTWIHLAGERGPTIDEMLQKRLGSAPTLDFVPGTKSAYSNLGYVVLGKIVERASGQGYEAYVTEHVLAPLGCRAAVFGVPADRATGYQEKWTFTNLMLHVLIEGRFFKGTVGRYQELAPLNVDGIPHGGLSGPADCLLRFARMAMNEGRGENGRVLEASSVRAMLDPTPTSDGRPSGFGLAWSLRSIDGEPVAEHLGGGGGYASGIRLYPRLGYAVAVLGSETNFRPHRLMRIVVSDPRGQAGGP